MVVFFILLSLSSLGYCDTIDRLAAPPLRLDPSPQIELSPGNRLLYKNNPEKLKNEEKANVQIFRGREIPWLAFGALIAVTALFYRPKRKEKKATQVEKIDPKKKALESLEVLHNTEDAMLLYIGLTSTVKNYFEEVFHVKATKETTEEFLKRLSTDPRIDSESKKALASFLQIADAVKFGKYLPTDMEREAAIAAAKKVIQE